MALVKPTQSRTRSRPTGAVKAAGLNSKEWVPCETRHTFVSIMSDSGVSDEQIADLVGHAKTSPTRTVYRHRLRSVITKGAERSKPLSAAAGRGSGSGTIGERRWPPSGLHATGDQAYWT